MQSALSLCTGRGGADSAAGCFALRGFGGLPSLRVVASSRLADPLLGERAQERVLFAERVDEGLEVVGVAGILDRSPRQHVHVATHLTPSRQALPHAGRGRFSLHPLGVEIEVADDRARIPRHLAGAGRVEHGAARSLEHQLDWSARASAIAARRARRYRGCCRSPRRRAPPSRARWSRRCRCPSAHRRGARPRETERKERANGLLRQASRMTMLMLASWTSSSPCRKLLTLTPSMSTSSSSLMTALTGIR